jgi:hypothetical protein
MDSEVLVSATAMIVSVLALGVTSTLSWVQVRSMRKANDLPVMIELLIKEYVNDEFQGRERLVIDSLPGLDREMGFERLPEPVRSAAYHVAWYYNATGLLVGLDAVDERMFVGGINYRIRRVWSAMEAHIEAERRVRGKPFLDGFEHLAARAFATDPRLLQRRLKLQKVAIGAERIDVRPPATRSPDEGQSDQKRSASSTLSETVAPT